MNYRSFKFVPLLSALVLFVAQSVAASAPSFAVESASARLRWKSGVIPVAVSSSLTKSNPYIKADGDAAAAIIDAVRRSLETWERAANLKFEIVVSDRQSISPAGKFGDGVSLITVAPTAENLLLFGGDAEETSARTRTFFNGRKLITEADIVLNPFVQFSTDGSIGTFDLEATLTHEIGHLLGLEHSIVSGATMFERQGKNGIYALPNLSARTLSEDDIAAARALYGAKSADVYCCGSIAGKLSIAGAKSSAKDVRVWAEEAEIGRVAAATLTNADGGFRIDGLAAGKYSIRAQDSVGKKSPSTSAQSFGIVEVGRNKISPFYGKLKLAAKTFDARFVGLNFQLSEIAVPLSGGKSFVVYVGGRNLDADNLAIGFDSPFFSVVPGSLSNQDYGSEMSVLSFEVTVSAKTPVGEYSFFLKRKSGEIVYSAGSLTIEEFAGSSGDFAFSPNE